MFNRQSVSVECFLFFIFSHSCWWFAVQTCWRVHLCHSVCAAAFLIKHLRFCRSGGRLHWALILKKIRFSVVSTWNVERAIENSCANRAQTLLFWCSIIIHDLALEQTGCLVNTVCLNHTTALMSRNRLRTGNSWNWLHWFENITHCFQLVWIYKWAILNKSADYLISLYRCISVSDGSFCAQNYKVRSDTSARDERDNERGSFLPPWLAGSGYLINVELISKRGWGNDLQKMWVKSVCCCFQPQSSLIKLDAVIDEILRLRSLDSLSRAINQASATTAHIAGSYCLMEGKRLWFILEKEKYRYRCTTEKICTLSRKKHYR